MAYLHINQRGSITVITTALCPSEAFLRYKDVVIRAAITECSRITDIVTNETWKRVKVHGIPLEPYIRKGTFGTEMLWADIMAENTWLDIPMSMRWMGDLSNIKERQRKGETVAA